MKILVIGASGLVGSHCLSLFKNKGFEARGTYLNYNLAGTSFFDPTRCFSEIKLNDVVFEPDVIVHCGALTNVDYCETHVAESYLSTVTSTKHIVEYSKKNAVKLIYLSTDYIFDGKKGPYAEDDVSNPLNIYGKHKLEAEDSVKQLDDFLIARITNVYGEEDRNKNFLARLLISLATNEEKTIDLPTDQFATPIYAGDIAKMLWHLIADGKNGIYNLASTDYLSRYQFGCRVKFHFKENKNLILNPISTSLINQSATRPLTGGLSNVKFSTEYPHFLFTSIDNYIKK
ncbi:SDR family oxidoreductase [Mucilaginibacter antarcticus]|uniref:dTDP-4-dehydrorhamnose reductase n=1 Tax=Mucilaginibacter antarcticus TaxID=1855725 RepID=A0ABW5XPN5_9SPHI